MSHPSSPPEAGAVERRVEHVLGILEERHRRYQRAALDEAVEIGEPLAPSLIALLDKVLQHPGWYAEAMQEGYAGHLYALALLAQQGEARAAEVVVRLARLPEDLLEELLGRAVLELLPAVLYRTCGRSQATLQDLAADPNAALDCRDAALGAMVYAALDGQAERAQVLGFLHGLIINPDRITSDIDVVSCAASRALDLCPEEHLDDIARAYRRGRINPFVVAREDFDRALAAGREPVLAESREAMAELVPRDVHGYLEGWVASEGIETSCDEGGPDPKARQRALEKKRRQERKRTRKARKRGRR